MTLTPQELQSALWIKLRDHMNERLESLRCQNDGDLTPEQTIKLRGRIACLKEILALGSSKNQDLQND